MGLFETAKRLGDPGFGHPERAQVHLMGSRFGKGGNGRPDRLLKEVLHLAWHARNEKEARLPQRHRETRCRTHGVRQNLGPFGEVALLRVRFRHHPSEQLELLPNPLDDAFVTAKLYPRSLRRRLRCEVIGRRSEPARHDHDTMRLGQPVDDRHDSIELVVHGEVLDDVEAQLGELLAQPRGVGVHQLATGELGANR